MDDLGEVIACKGPPDCLLEDCIGLERIVPQPPICEAIAPARLYTEEHRCPYAARFKTKDGKQFCQLHAEIWAANNERQ